ncbi:hypothetical protein [Nocardia salmonicida]|uniref:hypothetical protein n=1 Tax=Nocardia salmonicida TaxID=53431 RepID=UPI002E2CAB32|nr:hypothetical protein [Nocardia salmonicida]
MGKADPLQRAARLTDGQCPDCGTPTTVYRGNIHKFRCLECVTDVVGLAYRPADPQPRRDRVGHPVPPGCDAHGRPILPMGSGRTTTLTTNTETNR